MMRSTFPAALLLLAACSGGKDDESGPEATASIGPLQKAERPAPAETPGTAVEDIDVALLARQHERWNGAGVDWEVDQRGLPAEIIIPHVLVDGLEMPAWLAGRDVERD